MVITRTALQQLAKQWQTRLKPATITIKTIHQLAKDLQYAGFAVDHYAALKRSFPKAPALTAPQEFAQYVEQIADPEILGNAMASRCQQIKEWAWHDQVSAADQSWLQLALAQLTRLTRTLGDLQRVKLHAGLGGFMSCPQVGTVMGQSLLLKANGAVTVKTHYTIMTNPLKVSTGRSIRKRWHSCWRRSARLLIIFNRN